MPEIFFYNGQLVCNKLNMLYDDVGMTLEQQG